MVSDIYATYWGIVFKDLIALNVVVIIGSLAILTWIHRLVDPSIAHKNMIPLQERDYSSLISLKRHIILYFLVFTVPMEAVFLLANVIYEKVYGNLFNLVSSASSSALSVASAQSQIFGFVNTLGILYVVSGFAFLMALEILVNMNSKILYRKKSSQT